MGVPHAHDPWRLHGISIMPMHMPRSEKYDIILVSPRNYFLYTPLLPAVATGTCEERSIVEPVRNLLEGKVHRMKQEGKIGTTLVCMGYHDIHVWVNL